MPAGLVETELFGHEKGAFSGAAATKLGLFEAAEGGTLLLDEIGELPLTLQSRLLRFLDDHASRRAGGLTSRGLDVRIVAATNRDLRDDVRRGRFRQDLFFRLEGAPITIPPLRRRLADIPLLARDLLAASRRAHDQPPLSISVDAIHALVRHPWPGNVRELKHLMELLAVTVDGPQPGVPHLRELIRGNTPMVRLPSDEADKRRSLQKRAVRAPRHAKRPFMTIGEELNLLTKTRMLEALEATGWVQLQAARLLGMPRRTFVTKMRLYDLRRDAG